MPKLKQPTLRRSTTESSKGFPLGAMFLLIALFSVLLATNGLMGKSKDPQLIVAGISIGACAGFFLGLAIGLYHFRRFHGAFIGIVTGTIFGALIGPLCMRAIEKPWRATAISIAGGALLIAIAAIYRQLNGDDPVSTRYDYSNFAEAEDR